MNSLLQFLGPHSLLGRYGYLGIFSIIFLESMGLPLPGGNHAGCCQRIDGKRNIPSAVGLGHGCRCGDNG